MLIGLETSNVATILGSNVLLKPRGIPCTRLPRSRTSQRETNGAKCAIAFLEQLIVLCTDSSAALGFVKKGASRRTSPRGHQGPLYASLGDGTWTTYSEGTW